MFHRPGGGSAQAHRGWRAVVLMLCLRRTRRLRWRGRTGQAMTYMAGTACIHDWPAQRVAVHYGISLTEPRPAFARIAAETVPDHPARTRALRRGTNGWLPGPRHAGAEAPARRPARKVQRAGCLRPEHAPHGTSMLMRSKSGPRCLTGTGRQLPGPDRVRVASALDQTAWRNGRVMPNSMIPICGSIVTRLLSRSRTMPP
ncbi:hypothetical protein JOF47_000896 [Paeniglutamicibacter kerguelensis]|uniref:Uncharacterized protein n=1 Tax=Paeniglutamicibacter kerguelensis TaxID=254788 RepID=A0ABS4XA93_9MICC|nr:hypothetical protein [Paeniglutamicibacter kerguelensis]